MDQTRKRRLSSRRAAGHQSKVSRGEETDGLPSSDMRDEESAASHRVKIRASSPSDCSQERHATCLKISEDDAEKTLIITCDKDQGGIRPLGRRKGLRRKRETAGDVGHQQKVCEDDIQPEVEIDRELDRELENKSRQHNLTSANVRSIIHEVITNEHVVAMMKAAINETEPIPVFEPKMTRSKLKEVVEKGVVIPNWNISPIKKPTEVKKGPQFVDIPLEEEDSSDEEYRPDEDDEDETAEETLLESDLESAASSPRGSRVSLHRSHSEHEEERTSNSRPGLRRSRHLTVAVTPMGPPPPPAPSRAPPECSFLEKLHAVDEELAFGPDCMESYQTLSSANGEESLISFRTRSKRPLRDVPLGRLEAELRAPDITPDMYEFGSAPEDREWTQWLQGLMTSEMDNEEEGDDEDDPEYNFLADIDEPDVEDYRNDKAVRITKKEVNDLMEELFDAFQDELCGQDEEGHEEEEEKEEEESTPQEPAGTLENIPYEDPLTDVLKQQYRTVREQLAALRKRKALLESKGVSVPPSCPQRPSSSITPMILSSAQKLQLQQQIQQHVQLLTQVTMLSSSVKGLEPEASTSKQFLLELQMFAQQTRGPTEPGFTSIFRVCNLEGSLSLLEELDQLPKCDSAVPSLCFPGSQFPAHLAWLMVTRPVFLYPELLPEVQLRPCRFKGPFTSAEDCLVVLGHKHFRGTLHPLQMTCRYLLAARRFVRLKSHIRSTCHKPFPSVIKTYFVGGKCPPMPLACKRVSPCDQRPPVERDKSLMPDWLSKNLKLIYEHVKKYNQPSDNSESQATHPPENTQAEETIESGSPEPHYSFPPDTRYSPTLPKDLAQAIKPPDPCKKKKPSKLSESSKPALSAEKLEEVLSHLPTLLPKAPTVTGPLLCHPPVPQSQSLELQTISLRPELNPFTSVNEAMNSHKERPIIVSQVSKAPPVGQNLRGIVTLPTASVTTDLSSSSVRTAAVKNTVETPMGISGAPKIAQVGATQGNVIITLPTAAMAPVKSIPSGHVTVNQTGQMVSSNIATAVPAGSTQGGLIITFPPPPVSNTFICPTPIINTTSASTSLAKDHISQRCGTLLRLSTIPRDSSGLASPKPQFPSQKPLHRFLLLPPGCVFTSNSLSHQIAEPGQTLKHLTVLNSTQVELSRQETPETNNSVYKCVQEPAEEEELHDDGGNENEVDECVEKDSRDLFLTLSESSGSPAPSIGQDPDTDKEVMGNEEQGAKVKSRLQTEINQLAGANSFSEDLSGPELQQTIEKFSHLDTKTPSVMEDSDDGIHHPGTEEMAVKTPFVFNNDTLDEDPHRDAKDVAFAQAYLEKVYEVLQVAPGKVEEFLRVLSEFEKDPESRTSLELFRRLKPVLTDWPELLQDFAAFLHPDQARECGLLAEQQAFERSRRFLRQLELTLGEQSVLYRQVVHILQGGLAGSKEIKAQITLLLCDHPDLLEEFWVFFKQLYPHVQWHSDEDEDNAENVSIVEAIQEIEESQSCPPIRSLTPAEKMKPLKTAIKHRRKRDKNNKMAELRKHNSRRNTVATQLENDVDSSSSVDSQQSSFKPAGTSVCAKNISCMPNGKKVVLWTREADRVILTTCQQRGAKPATFHAIATQLGNKTANEVLERFQDLIKLFRKSSKLCHTSQSDTEEQSSIIEDEPD